MRTIKSISILFVLSAVGFLASNCQHDDENVVPVKGPDPITHGTETVVCTDCTPLVSNGASSDFNSGNVPAGVWYFDKSHSNVEWESPYKVFGSLLTGRFNYFVLKNFNFNEAAPASLSFEGYVRLNTVNTGEPGRDAGCLLGTFGTEAGKTSEVENLASIISIPGTGRYSATDAGFIVDANFTFHGVTKQVTVKLFYYPQTDQGSYKMTGISAQFEFLALSDFAISSTNIDDKVVVKMNVLLRNKNS
jgi:polyisoprenoid-binding protein YceI